MSDARSLIPKDAGHVGELIVHGMQYRIFSRAGGGAGFADEHVGELRIGNERYLVSRSDEVPARDRDQSDKSFKTLTRREIQIVMLVAEGNVNKQIADKLRISEWTIATHLRRIFVKLDVDSRSAMVYKYLITAQELKNPNNPRESADQGIFDDVQKLGRCLNLSSPGECRKTSRNRTKP
jgi:DNA-binding CsgD family transcriptional regulator